MHLDHGATELLADWRLDQMDSRIWPQKRLRYDYNALNSNWHLILIAMYFFFISPSSTCDEQLAQIHGDGISPKFIGRGLAATAAKVLLECPDHLLTFYANLSVSIPFLPNTHPPTTSIVLKYWENDNIADIVI